MWYIDMTATELFTLSDATFDLLRDIKADVNIIFCMDPDEVKADQMLYYVQNTAKLLAKEFKNIHIIYKDVVRNYNFLKNTRQLHQLRFTRQASLSKVELNTASTKNQLFYKRHK